MTASDERLATVQKAADVGQMAGRLREVAGLDPKNWTRHRAVAQKWAAEAAVLIASRAAGLAMVTALAESRLEDAEIHCEAANKLAEKLSAAEAALAKAVEAIESAYETLSTYRSADMTKVIGDLEDFLRARTLSTPETETDDG